MEERDNIPSRKRHNFVDKNGCAEAFGDNGKNVDALIILNTLKNNF